jgi:hypothetical protein
MNRASTTTAAILFATTITSIHSANLSNCRRGCQTGERCVGNSFSQPVTDEQCYKCGGGQDTWPCSFETLCYCSSVQEGTPRIPPAPSSGFKANDELLPCGELLTEDVFNAIVQPESEEGRALFTYNGLCAAIIQYNGYHDEKFAAMGTEEQMRAELAAFLAHAASDTQTFSVTREQQHCVDPLTGPDGKIYCKPCREENYNKQTKTCSQPYTATDGTYKEYCDVTRQGDSGCNCPNVTEVDPSFLASTGANDTVGYVAASDMFIERGAIASQWNYDYLGGSLSLYGDKQLCDDPDQVATNPEWAWGIGITHWMDHMQFGTTGSTAHQQIMKGNFGGTVEVLYGDLECPANEWGSLLHAERVKDRVAQICKTGSALGVYVEMNKCDIPTGCLSCDGISDIYDSCQQDGTCPACATWTDFVRSSAPTVVPLRVQPPSWEDWSNSNYNSRSGGDIIRISACLWSVAVVTAASFLIV